jgi:hypothetical protein
VKTLVLLIVLGGVALADSRFEHGARVGWMYVEHIDKPTREDGSSLMEKYDLESPHMMLLGYEASYRVTSHSWLDVLLVGNFTVAGLEQSRPIPAASALVGFEFSRRLQLGVGVNVTPDDEAPSHAIFAMGWTPRVGSLSTPLHVFWIPDPDHNTRYGATVGVTW